uniref:CSON006055 protein n=1 Tax=Culicoides sonorensis TaxID=179676 RepID=A0A336L754_CULSO
MGFFDFIPYSRNLRCGFVLIPICIILGFVSIILRTILLISRVATYYYVYSTEQEFYVIECTIDVCLDVFGTFTDICLVFGAVTKRAKFIEIYLFLILLVIIFFLTSHFGSSPQSVIFFVVYIVFKFCCFMCAHSLNEYWKEESQNHMELD